MKFFTTSDKILPTLEFSKKSIKACSISSAMYAGLNISHLQLNPIVPSGNSISNFLQAELFQLLLLSLLMQTTLFYYYGSLLIVSKLNSTDLLLIFGYILSSID